MLFEARGGPARPGKTVPTCDLRDRLERDGDAGFPSGWPPRLSAALDIALASPHPVWICWGEDRRLFYNDACSVILGPRHPQAFGAPGAEGFGPLWSRIAGQIAGILEAQVPPCAEADHISLAETGAGEGHGAQPECHYALSFTPIGALDSPPEGVLCMMSDVTQLRSDAQRAALDAKHPRSAPDAAPDADEDAGPRGEADLEETGRALEIAQERIELELSAGTVIGTWVWNLQDGTFTADERFARTFGLDPAAARTGLPLAQAVRIIHPEDRDQVDRLIERAMREGGDYRARYRTRHADGQYRWVEACGHCEQDAAGQPIRFPRVLIDIEKHLRVETALRRREADLALLLDATADAFYAVDTEGRTTRCNAAFLRMLGFNGPEEVVGRKLHDVIHHSHPDGSHYAHEDCPIYRVAGTGEVAHVDHELFFRTDGTSFPVEYWVQPVFWEGALQGAVCTILDISERRQAEDSRQLLLRELNHRIKNLFSITASMIQMTARSASSVDEMAQALRGRVLSLSRAHDLITTAISRTDDPDAPSDLAQLIETVMAPHIGTRPGALSAAGPALPIGPSATTSLALILHELATNAVKYGALSEPRGTVSITWTRNDAGLTLEWRESGGPGLEGAPTRRGFGSRLARLSATGQLGGDIRYDWAPDGVRIELTVAATSLVL
ncbi:sensor histidine kinase [Profundibacterium mesophilum]|uniref:histidine kinase n=1 Tax=Profundibacterium mesophilum KAUST100406-0324 TaxID=1037889 RepID=A0A921NU99_9RHOB|nr:PAS domain S-box protein [Profundibacterium mesophilum]KAF0676759.1 two-component system chemotaxis family CheBCheR fusion protein [Profundibacterium mesophilum KAUST100406-0324]